MSMTEMRCQIDKMLWQGVQRWQVLFERHVRCVHLRQAGVRYHHDEHYFLRDLVNPALDRKPYRIALFEFLDFASEHFSVKTFDDVARIVAESFLEDRRRQGLSGEVVSMYARAIGFLGAALNRPETFRQTTQEFGAQWTDVWFRQLLPNYVRRKLSGPPQSIPKKEGVA